MSELNYSKYFTKTCNQNNDETEDLADRYIHIENDLLSEVNKLNYGPDVVYIYSPLEYASQLHKAFLKKFLFSNKKVLFLGINPGPWGMCQTGIPFGEVNIVRSYLKIDGEVLTPQHCHPQRPVNGLNCHRSEESGKRLWNLFKEFTKDDPYKFFNHCFIHNYFPLSLMNTNAKNITPSDLKSAYKKKLQEVCDKSLSYILTLLDVNTIVAIGKYAEKRSNEVIKTFKLNKIKVVTIPHPSRRNVRNTKQWPEETVKLLESFDIIKLFK